MENLPGEIIVDILSRLPVKSLLQFRCVSKQWCTLISDPQFSKSHLKRASKDHQRVLLLPLLDQSESVLSFDADCAVVEQIEVPFKGSNFGLTVLGSCNGLVCLCCRKEMFLWNPSTRAYKRLRKPRFVNYGYFFGGVGYDSSIDDYKVVRAAVLCYCHDRDGIVVKGSDIRVEVYTLRTNTWKRIDDLNNVNLIYHKLGYFFNGALHWQMNRGHDDVIVSFDLVEEKFQEMLPLPDEGEETNVKNRLGVLGGRLCIYRPSVEKHEVLTMEDYKIKASWTKLMDIPLRTIFDYKLLMPLCYTKNGEILMKVGEMIVVIYNLKENTWRKVPNPEGMSYFDASVYVESLISPNGLQTYNQRQGRMMKKRRQG